MVRQLDEPSDASGGPAYVSDPTLLTGIAPATGAGFTSKTPLITRTSQAAIAPREHRAVTMPLPAQPVGGSRLLLVRR
jgi:hypothetical protein